MGKSFPLTILILGGLVFLTIVFKIAVDKNIDGQGYRRRHGEKIAKATKLFSGLSKRKEKIMRRALANFTVAYCQLIRWSLANWNNLPFTFPISKDGIPVLDKKGQQKIGLTSAHYLANWLGTNAEVPKVRANVRLENGFRNQVAETLLSQFRLRQTAERQPGRLTGPVEFPNLLTESEFADRRVPILKMMQWRHLSGGQLDQVVKLLKVKPNILPITFPDPSDFRLFRHRITGRLFVCLALLSKEEAELQPMITKDPLTGEKRENFLELLRFDGKPLPNSRLWVLLPLRRRLEAEEFLADPNNKLRTAELRLAKDGSWRFNIVVNVPEPETIRAETFLAVKFGFYRIHWRLTDDVGVEKERSEIDLTHLQPLIEEAAARRSRAFSRFQTRRLPNYRGKLKLEREKVVNQLIAISRQHRAAIGVEDVSNVEKSTWSGRANLFRSHWDFGRMLEVLTYKSVLAGLPLARRGRKKRLHLTSSFQAAFTHASCGADNKAGVRVAGGKTICPICQTADPVTDNALAVIGQRLINYFSGKGG